MCTIPNAYVRAASATPTILVVNGDVGSCEKVVGRCYYVDAIGVICWKAYMAVEAFLAFGFAGWHRLSL